MADQLERVLAVARETGDPNVIAEMERTVTRIKMGVWLEEEKNNEGSMA